MYAKIATLAILSAMSASCAMQKPANYDAALSLCISEAAQAVTVSPVLYVECRTGNLRRTKDHCPDSSQIERGKHHRPQPLSPLH
jgi:hypothetical protein